MMFGRGVDVRADARDRAIERLDLGNAEVSDLNRLAVGREQQVLRLDVAVNHVALVRVSESGADLFEIMERALKRQRIAPTECGHIAAGQVFEHEIMESVTGEVERRAMTEAVDDVRV